MNLFKEAELIITLCRIKNVIKQSLEKEFFILGFNLRFKNQIIRNILDTLDNLKKYKQITKYKMEVKDCEVKISLEIPQSVKSIYITMDIKFYVNQK